MLTHRSLQTFHQGADDQQQRSSRQESPRDEAFRHPPDDLALQVIGQRAETTHEIDRLRLEEDEGKADREQNDCHDDGDHARRVWSHGGGVYGRWRQQAARDVRFSQIPTRGVLVSRAGETGLFEVPSSAIPTLERLLLGPDRPHSRARPSN